MVVRDVEPIGVVFLPQYCISLGVFYDINLLTSLCFSFYVMRVDWLGVDVAGEKPKA